MTRFKLFALVEKYLNDLINNGDYEETQKELREVAKLAAEEFFDECIQFLRKKNLTQINELDKNYEVEQFLKDFLHNIRHPDYQDETGRFICWREGEKWREKIETIYLDIGD